MWLILALSCVLAFVIFTCSLISNRTIQLGRTPNNNIETNIELNEPDYAIINDIINRDGNITNADDVINDDVISMVSSVARLRTNDEEGYMKIKISYSKSRKVLQKSNFKGFKKFKFYKH